MKLINADSILLLNIIILVLILGYLIYKLEYESGIFIKNDIFVDLCKKEISKNKESKGLLANKIRVKEFNRKYFPNLKCAKTLYLFDLKNTHDYHYEYVTKPDFKEIYSSLPQKYIIKCSVGGFNHHIVKKNNLEELKKTCDNILYKEVPRIVKEAKGKNQQQHLQYSPQIYIEEYLGDNLLDYKFQMIHGKIAFLVIRQRDLIPNKVKFYNENGIEMPNRW